MTHLLISIPHPVMTPRNSDYQEGYGFDANVGVSLHGKKMIISVRYDLRSSFLSELVRSGSARYFLVIKCSKTFRRNVYSTDNNSGEWSVDADNYSGKISLTPYIASVKKITSFRSGEHITDVREFNPDGFDLPTGSILAITDPFEIAPDSVSGVESIIRVAPDLRLDEDMYRISLDNEYVSIMLNSKTHQRIKKLMEQHKDLLLPSIYTAAVEYAIRNMDGYPGSKWAISINAAMEKKGIVVNDGEEHVAAQKILEWPLTKLFTMIEGEYDDE